MTIKRFFAKNFPEAMKMIKKELGPEAIILSSEQKPTGVEVVAAVEKEEPQPSDNIVTLKREIEQLKEALRRLGAAGYEFNVPEQRRRLLHVLKKNAIKEEFALRLCERCKDINEMIALLTNEIKAEMPEGHQKAVMVVGPTGVGKTTTLMKLVARAIRHGSTVGVICLDSYKIGAVDYLKRFCQVLRLPFRMVNTTEALPEAILALSSRDRVFIDTPGRSPSDRAYLKAMERFFIEFPEVETYLLMSANYDWRFLETTYQHYREFPVSCLGITKIDEVPVKGHIYNILSLYQKPVGFLTNGQRIPHDIVFPDSKELALMCLGVNEVKGGVHEAWA
ncbi:MAG: hypothetical protein D6778_04355 [Nitrospirae bacterium]|nr:MAG: hypothetical protein D6778_04355 [Nitrospirota bacterium]